MTRLIIALLSALLVVGAGAVAAEAVPASAPGIVKATDSWRHPNHRRKYCKSIGLCGEIYYSPSSSLRKVRVTDNLLHRKKDRKWVWRGQKSGVQYYDTKAFYIPKGYKGRELTFSGHYFSWHGKIFGSGWHFVKQSDKFGLKIIKK